MQRASGADTLLRNKQIREARASGKTLRQLADQFGITAERVRRICLASSHGSAANRTGLSSTFSKSDYETIRTLQRTYGLRGVILEVARLADNFGYSGSKKWASVGRKMRASLLTLT